MPEATEMQQMEMDMVEGMFTDTYRKISDDPPSYSVEFSATPDDPPELRITISYPDESYPESGSPAIQLESISKERRIQTSAVLVELNELAAEHLGMHCAVVLLQRCQEYLSNVVEEQEKQALQKRGDAMAAASTVTVTVDPTIRMGNAISRELFVEWQTRHLAEKAALRAEIAKRTQKESASKLTGRQLWDTTIRHADWELFDAGEGDAMGLDDAGFDYVLDDEEGEEGEEYDLGEGGDGSS